MDMAIQHIKNGFTKNKEKLQDKKMDWEEEERVRDKEIKNIKRKLKTIKIDIDWWRMSCIFKYNVVP